MAAAVMQDKVLGFLEKEVALRAVLQPFMPTAALAQVMPDLQTRTKDGNKAEPSSCALFLCPTPTEQGQASAPSLPEYEQPPRGSRLHTHVPLCTAWGSSVQPAHLSLGPGQSMPGGVPSYRPLQPGSPLRAWKKWIWKDMAHWWVGQAQAQ